MSVSEPRVSILWQRLLLFATTPALSLLVMHIGGTVSLHLLFFPRINSLTIAYPVDVLSTCDDLVVWATRYK